MIWRLEKLIVVLPLVFAVPVAAQEAGCQQRAGAVCGNGNLARVASNGDDASLSHGGDFTPVKASEGLSAGDRLLLGTKSAQVVLGDSCSKSITPGSLTTITRQGNLLCASEFAKVDSGSKELGEGGPSIIPGVDNTTAVVGAGVVAAAGGGLAVALSNHHSKPTFVPVVSNQ